MNSSKYITYLILLTYVIRLIEQAPFKTKIRCNSFAADTV